MNTFYQFFIDGMVKPRSF